MAIPLSKAKLSFFRRFRQKKVRREEGMFLIEGWHLIQEALKADRKFESVIFDPTLHLSAEFYKILQASISKAANAFEADAHQLSQIVDTESSQGICALLKTVSVSWDSFLDKIRGLKVLRLVILDEVSDPGNCGTIVRAGDWFGLDGAILGRNCAELENTKVSRSTMGSLFHLPIASNQDLEVCLPLLRSLGVSIISSELDRSDDVYEFSWPSKAALVIGSEARGVSQMVSNLSDTRLSISRFGQAESLNAAMAASIFMSCWRRPDG